MEAEVILDTDVIIDYLKRRPDSTARQIFQAIKAGRITAHMTSITVFEISRGARLSPQPEKSMKAVKVLQDFMKVLPFDDEAAEAAAEICVKLEKKGKPLEIRDLFIAASAKTHKLTLTTRNVAHFSRIPDVKVTTPKDLLKRL